MTCELEVVSKSQLPYRTFPTVPRVLVLLHDSPQLTDRPDRLRENILLTLAGNVPRQSFDRSGLPSFDPSCFSSFIRSDLASFESFLRR